MLVDLDSLLFIELDADFFRAETFRERSAADRNKHFVGFEFQFLATFRCRRSRAAIIHTYRADFCFEVKSHALGGERALKQVRQFEIESDRDARQKFQHRHFRTEPVPDRTEFEPDRAGADHQQFLWRLGETQRFGAADDCFAVKLRERQFHRHAAGRDDDVFRLDLLCLAAGRFDRNFSRRGDRAEAFEHRHLVRLHQRAHAAVECLYDLVLALLHLCEIDARAVDHDAVLRRLFFDEHEMIARREQRFARDAADVQAGAAEFLVLSRQWRFSIQAGRRGSQRHNRPVRSQ